VKDLPVGFSALSASLFVTGECDLVATLSRQPLTPLLRDRALARIESGVDWDRAFNLAKHWEVEPVFFSNLLRLDSKIPKEIVGRAAQSEMQARARATAATLWAVDVVRQMEGVGIPCIMLKGPALGVIAYDDLSFRTFADADLLVTKDDLIRARDHLQGLGFEPLFDSGDEEILVRNGHALEFANSGRKVELHWTLLSHHLALDLPADDLWNSATSIEIAGRELRTLDRVSLFLFLCAHGAKHEWERFRWVCDIAQLAERLTDVEMARVGALARQHNARRIVLLATEMARLIAYADTLGLGQSGFGDASRVTSLVKRAAYHYESLADLPPSPGQSDFGSRFAALTYWMGARERLRDRLLVLSRAFLAPVNSDQGNLPVRILFRSARLMLLAFRRLTIR